MVGDAGDQGGAADRLTTDLRAAYDAAAAELGRRPGADVRAAGAGAGRLPRRCRWPAARCSTWARAPGWPAGPRSRPGRGGWWRRTLPSACCAGRARTLHPVAADAAALPFRDGSFDLVVAAFSLSHLGILPAGLGEARRVGRAHRRQHVRAGLEPSGQGRGR